MCEQQISTLTQQLKELRVTHQAARPHQIWASPLRPRPVAATRPVPPTPVTSPVKRGPTTPTGHTGIDVPTRIRRERILIAFDFETTGLGLTADIRIREIGAVPVASSLKANDAAVASMKPFRMPVDPQKAVDTTALAVAPDASDASSAQPWSVVGPLFHAWLHTVQGTSEPAPTIVLGGYNSKRYDSRIWAFENARAGVTDFPVDLHFVDLMAVFRQLAPEVETPRTLANFHDVLLNRRIASMHTALGDSIALRDIVDSFPRERLWQAVDQHLENADGVYHRCELDVAPAV